MNGTTDGQVYTLTVNDEPKYVLKQDSKQNISLVEHLHQAYIHSALLPKLLYIDPAKTFIVYPYINGTTHYKRGTKNKLVQFLLRIGVRGRFAK